MGLPMVSPHRWPPSWRLAGPWKCSHLETAVGGVAYDGLWGCRTYLETLSAFFFEGGKCLLNLRRKLVKTPEFCKNAGEFKKCRIYRCMLRQQSTEKIQTCAIELGSQDLDHGS